MARLEIHVPPGPVEPGSTLHGEVEVVEPGRIRELRIELGAVEATRRGRELRRVVSSVDVPAPGGLVPGQRRPFRIEVPRDLVRGYQLTNSARRVDVAARGDQLGPDEVTAAMVETTPPDPQDVDPDKMARALERAEKTNTYLEIALGVLFSAIGLFFLGVSVVWWNSPPEAWEEGDRTGIWFGVGLGSLCLLCGLAVVFAQRGRSDRFETVTLSPRSTVLRPGDELVVDVANGSGRPLDLGLVLIERYVTGHQSTTASDTNSGDRFRVERSEWVDLPVGTSTQRFVVPEDAPPSYGGEFVGADHVLRVVKAGRRSSRWKTATRDERVIVV